MSDRDMLTAKLNRFAQMISKRNDPQLVAMFNEVADEIEGLIRWIDELEYTQMTQQINHRAFLDEMVSIKRLKHGAYRTYRQLKQYNYDRTCNLTDGYTIYPRRN